VLTAMPSEIVRMAARAKLGLFRSVRAAYATSARSIYEHVISRKTAKHLVLPAWQVYFTFGLPATSATKTTRVGISVHKLGKFLFGLP
jgi:hypothetical protein